MEQTATSANHDNKSIEEQKVEIVNKPKEASEPTQEDVAWNDDEAE